MHLDLSRDDTSAQVARLIDLGARFVRPSDESDDDDYVVLTDAEGNEFCVCTRAESSAPQRG